MQLKNTLSWTLLLSALIVLFIADLFSGSVKIPLLNIFKVLSFQENNSVFSEIIWNFRMTKALTCIVAGSALALAGLQMQTLFRNPLAGPDVLGLTSGASLFVSLVYLTGVFQSGIIFSASLSVALAASLGCASVFILMFVVSTKVKDNASLLIVGLMVGAGTSSIVSVLQYASKAEELQNFMLWSFGTLGSLNWVEIQILSVVLLLGIMIAIINMKAMNGWLLGDFYAHSIGINISRTRLLMILSASILTGGVTAFCGPIAFVGLAVPHLVKILIKTTNHKQLLPAVLLGGGILLLFCDIIANLPGSDTILPVNAITALIGAPVVIWVILKNKAVRS